jgi:hypothetical protein
MRLRNNFWLLKDSWYLRLMKTVDTALNFDASDVAHFRLHCVELFISQGWIVFHQAFPQVGRRTIYRWRRTYLDSSKRLASLFPHSTKPHTVRQMQVPTEVLGFLKALRKKYPRMSKYKLKPFLDAFCQEKGKASYSVSWIGKVIVRYQLFFNSRRPVKRKRSQSKKQRISYCPKLKHVGLGYLQLDGVEIVFAGIHYRFLTAVELITRQAWVKRVPTFSSSQAKEFLEAIIASVDYQIHTIQTDNGSEFAGVFDAAIKTTIKHLWSYPQRPKTQGYVERFNWTLQDEFLNYEIDQLTCDAKRFDKKLANWLAYYNTQRPHQGLNYLTPKQKLLSLQSSRDVGCAKSV